MPRVAPEDVQVISHINHICDSIHDFADNLYEDLMDREHESIKKSAQELINHLNDLIYSMSDEI